MIGPAVEALRESTRLFVLERKEEFSLTLGLFDSHVLDVDLKHKMINVDFKSQMNLMAKLEIANDTIVT